MEQNLIPRFGWIGLGSMGLGMAKNLQRHLKTLSGAFNLVYTNRTISRGHPLAELGGTTCQTVGDIVQQADVVFISTSDDAALKDIIRQVVNSGDIRTKIIVETTTVSPNTARDVYELLQKAEAVYVASPVFGASPLAESGQLLFILAGPSATINMLVPYIKGVMGRDVMNVGEDPPKALLMKTTGNFITASLMEILSEAHVFAEKSGLGTDTLEKLIELNWGGILHTTSTRITSGAYIPREGERPRSDLKLAIKDVQHGITSARDVGTRLKTAEVIMKHYKEAEVWANEHDGRSLDSSSMYGVIRQKAGLDFESDVVKNHAR